MEYEFSVQFRGNTLTVISAEVGAELEAVLSFARDAHYARFRRLCTDVRLATAEERPPLWMRNPIPSQLGELWMVVVVWEEGFPPVTPPPSPPQMEEHLERGDERMVCGE